MLERFRLSFRVRIHGGVARVTHGQTSTSFTNAVNDIARLHNIRSGTIECKGQGRHARLHFSRDFPEQGRQAIRNAWTPPTGPGSGGNKRASG